MTAPDAGLVRSRAAEFLTSEARAAVDLAALAQHAHHAGWAETADMTRGELRAYLARIIEAAHTSTLTASWADGASISTQPDTTELIGPETIRLLQSHADYLDARADAWSRYNPPISAETTAHAGELRTLIEAARLLNTDAHLRSALDAARGRQAANAPCTYKDGI